MRSTTGAGRAAGHDRRIVGRCDERYCTVSRDPLTPERRFPIPIDATFSGESSLALLVGLAVVFRVAGAAARGADIGLARPLGWLLCACAAWLSGAAAGAFAPIGPALIVGALFSLVDRTPAAEGESLFGQRRLVSALGDAAVLTVSATLSIPTMPPALAVGTIATVIVAGAIIDLAVAPRSAPLRGVLVLLPLLLWIGYGLVFPQARAEFKRETWPQLQPAAGFFFAAGRADVGTAVELETGSIAWLTLPPGPPPYRPALFFHGADGDGAYQRGALFIRRVLASVGYAVLAVDERGFGASPPPPDIHDLEGWDPEPTSAAAARYLESLPRVEGSVLAVGHSMGATRALRFADGWLGASAAVIMGATVMPPAEDNERLYGRFLNDFDLEESGLTPDFVLDVRNRYFNNDVAARAMYDGHPPVLFVRFSFDYENVIAGRNALFRMIPGHKVGWELRSDHQLASSRVSGVLTGDWRIMRRLQAGLSRFVEGRSPHDGSPMRVSPRR